MRIPSFILNLGAAAAMLSLMPREALAAPSIPTISTEAVAVDPTTGALKNPVESVFKSANHLTIGTDVQAFNAALAVIAANSGTLSLSGVSISSPITSTVTTGTAPFSISSTTVVPNLNASLLGGATFASPGTIGGATAGASNFTTIHATGQITSTVTTGTAPLIVSSTTNVANLNASSLNGATFANPGVIGTTPAAASFTTVNASGVITGIGSGLTKLNVGTGATYVILDGDSLTQGYSGTTAFSVYLAADSYCSVSGITVNKTALSGAQIPTGSNSGNNVTDNYAADLHPHRSTAHGGDGGAKPFLFELIGTNDIGTAGRTSSQVITDLTTFVTLAHTDGFVVGLGLIPYRNDGVWNSTKEAYRIAVNTAISIKTPGNDFVYDIGQYCEQTNNTTFYQSDQLHFTSPMNSLIADGLNGGLWSGFFPSQFNPQKNVQTFVQLTDVLLNTSDQSIATATETAIDFRVTNQDDLVAAAKLPYLQISGAGWYRFSLTVETLNVDWNLLLHRNVGGTLSGSGPATLSGGTDILAKWIRASTSGAETIGTQTMPSIDVQCSSGDIIWIGAKQSSGSAQSLFHSFPGTELVITRLQ